MKERILIVDDDPALLTALPETLRHRMPGIEVDTAADVHQALTMTSNTQYDCVLCDIRMPVMDGVAFMVKARAAISDLPVILMTGAGEDRLRRQALHAGANAFVTKPLDPLFLAGLLHCVIQDARHNRAAAHFTCAT